MFRALYNLFQVPESLRRGVKNAAGILRDHVETQVTKTQRNRACDGPNKSQRVDIGTGVPGS